MMAIRGARWLPLLLVPACAWDAGEPFGEVRGELTARWTAPGSRDLGDGWQKLASDLEVRIDAATWTTTGLELVAAAAAAIDFDPAAPPPGYSLCHGGHCHHDDGRLVSYEDIAAELAGGEPPAAVARFDTGRLDLVAGARVALDCGQPCPLPLTTVGRAVLGIAAVDIAGAVRDGRQQPRFAGERAFTVALTPAAPLPVVGRTSLVVDRSEDPVITLTVAVEPTAALLDRVAWDTLAASPGTLDIATDAASVTFIIDQIGGLELAVSATRSR
jgi:hypothetical protein